MNNQTNRKQVGRLTGRTELDAGLMRYREMLGQTNHQATRRRAVGVVAVASLLVLVLSIGSMAQTAGIGCLYLTPGFVGGGTAFAGVERAPGIGLSITAVSENSLELTVTGRIFLQRVARYNGELCKGPYMFAP